MSENIIVDSGRLAGTVTVPISKSFLHRALICRALSGLFMPAPDLDALWKIDMPDGLPNPVPVDISATMSCLRVLFSENKGVYQNRDFSDIAGAKIEETLEELYRLHCNESGSTLRFFIPIAAALGKPVIYTGEGLLPERPLGEYADLFRDASKGVSFQFLEKGRSLPLLVQGQLRPGRFELPGNVSSQYITGLLLALPLLEQDSEIVLTTELESSAYVNITLAVMKEFGIQVFCEENRYTIPGGQKYECQIPYTSEADYSQAAFWLVLKYLGHEISVQNLPVSGLQGDGAIQKFLLGLEQVRDGKIPQLPEGSSFQKSGDTPVLELNISQVPDIVPVLAVAAAATPCITKFIRAGRLRIKECDRLTATCEMLSAFGIKTVEEKDSFIVHGRIMDINHPDFIPACIHSRNDHRMVMAAAVAATCTKGKTEITDWHAVRKSYPAFFKDFRDLGGIAQQS